MTPQEHTQAEDSASTASPGLRRRIRRFLAKCNERSYVLNNSQVLFNQFLSERDRIPRDFSSLECEAESGLVSIVLPVFNGERYLAAAIDSILRQTYSQWELILVDDGSTDATPAIAAQAAAKDPRVSIIRQDNRGLPAALNAGHARVRGEFVTWTSDDNLLEPDFLTRFVQAMRARPDVDLFYGDLCVIGEDGKPIPDAAFHRGAQFPPGSGRLRLPRHVSKLHEWNCIGAAFLYRRRVLPLIGAYAEHWMTCEDYDFFLRVNAEFSIRHLPGNEPLYQYREHGASLTAASRELRIAERNRDLLRFDDARRELIGGPRWWIFDAAANAEAESARTEILAFANTFGDPVLDAQAATEYIPIPGLRVSLSPPGGSRSDASLVRNPADKRWTLTLPRIGFEGAAPHTLHTPSIATAFHALRAYAASRYTRALEQFAFHPPPAARVLSVIICTARSEEFVSQTLESLRGQTMSAEDYEIIVVDNAVLSRARPLVLPVREHGPEIRVIPCVPQGLSHARNTGMLAARGEILVYLDDDIEAEPNLLERIAAAFRADEAIGVLGGVIQLRLPENPPRWLGPNLAKFWSHFDPGSGDTRHCGDWREFPYGANWSARRAALARAGGFRAAYGRGGRIADCGEDLAAAADIAALDFRVAVEPTARVLHLVDPKRFTLRDLFASARLGYRALAHLTLDGRLLPPLPTLLLPVKAAAHFLLSVVPLPRPLPQRLESLAISMAQIYAFGLLTRNLARRILQRAPERVRP